MSRLVVDNKFLIIPSSRTDRFSGWTNDTWATFTSSGINITSMIDVSTYNHWAHVTPNIHLVPGDKIYFKYWITLNLGSYPNNCPYLSLQRSIYGGVGDLTMNPTFNAYEYSFTISIEGDYFFRIGNQLRDVNASSTFEFYTKAPLKYLSG